MHSLMEFWGGLNPWFRFGIAAIFLLISTILFFLGRFWPWGWGIGIVLLIFSFPNANERKGYHDF